MVKQSYHGLVIVLLMFGSLTYGDVITVHVSGVVDSVTTQGDFTFDSSLSIDSLMNGFCIYDTDTPDLDGDSYHGRYVLQYLSMTIGNYTFTHDPLSPDPAYFEVWKGDTTYLAKSSDGILNQNGSLLPYDDIAIVLLDLCNASVSGPDDALPVSFPDISFFTWRNRFDADYSGSGVGFDINGHLTSIYTVPEPATLLFVVLGAVFLRIRR